MNPQHTQFCGQTTVIKRTPSEPSQVPAYERFVKIVQCLFTINIQWLPCAVIKFHVVEEAKKDRVLNRRRHPAIDRRLLWDL